MRDISLSRGKVAFVDDDDYELVGQHQWHAQPNWRNWYAAAHVRTPDGRSTTVYMHRLILGNPASHVDHRNGDGLDNRRANLRLATSAQNQRNRRARRGFSSRFKGVFWDRQSWRAALYPPSGRVYLGSFPSEEAAARAYDAAALELYGDWARLNFPEESPAGPCDLTDPRPDGGALRVGAEVILP